MRNALLIGFIAAISTVVGVAAWRLSIDALALIIGVGLGFILMTPVAGVLWWAARNNARTLQDQASHTFPQPPPVIVVQPGTQPATPIGVVPKQTQSPILLPPPGYPVHLPAAASIDRHWDLRVYGDENASDLHEISPENAQRYN